MQNRHGLSRYTDLQPIPAPKTPAVSPGDGRALFQFKDSRSARPAQATVAMMQSGGPLAKRAARVQALASPQGAAQRSAFPQPTPGAAESGQVVQCSLFGSIGHAISSGVHAVGSAISSGAHAVEHFLDPSKPSSSSKSGPQLLAPLNPHTGMLSPASPTPNQPAQGGIAGVFGAVSHAVSDIF